MPKEPTISLSQDQIDFYHENGFLALDSITTPEEVELMRAAYDRIFAERAGREEGNQFDLAGTDEDETRAALPQILNPSKYAPELKDTLAEANALAICRQLLNSDEVRGGPAHAIFKPARYGAATPWHQDEAYWNPAMDHQSISVWIPLQPATLENGCMQFLPGTHRLEVLRHRSINNDPRIHGLEVEEDGALEYSSAVACPLPAGGATFHPGRTFHYTAPNNSDLPRRALILGFSLPPAPREDERRFPWMEAKATARIERATKAARK